MITPAQIRAARALLNMKQAELAEAAGVSLATLNNIERGVTDPRVSTLEAVQRALESVGVIFIPENGEGPGVRLRRSRQSATIIPDAFLHTARSAALPYFSEEGPHAIRRAEAAIEAAYDHAIRSGHEDPKGYVMEQIHNGGISQYGMGSKSNS
ncbi:helix-turn-helix transcriptional regulator [Azospirillum argentinense]